MDEIKLRAVDYKRLDSLQERTENPPSSSDIWFVHVVLAQCFFPYTDQKDARDWMRRNGDYSIMLTSGTQENPEDQNKPIVVGLPFGAKPRLFQSYINTQAIKQKSPVIQVERSMSAMLKELGYGVRGGKKGTINSFKDQITRFALCNFTIVAPGPRGTRSYIKAPPIERFDVWFPPDPEQNTLWPSEIVLTDKYYESLKDHAIPYDYRALKAIQNKPRAQDIYLWMTQRLCRIPHNKPLLMKWSDLYEMFGGASSKKEFKRNFPNDLIPAKASYPAARIEEHKEGYLFYSSEPPIRKTKLVVKK